MKDADLITKAEASRRLECSPGTVERLYLRDSIKGKMVAGRLHVSATSIESLLEKQGWAGRVGPSA